MLGLRLPQIGLSFVSWHRTQGSLSGGWDFIKILYTYNIQCKFLMSTYQESHLSESIQTWTIHVCTWGDLYGGIIHDDPFPGVGLEVKV